MPLPPRKFYTLQQAADKLSRDFKEPVTIEDLLHYWTFDNLKLSVYFCEYPIVFRLGNLEFYKKNNLAESTIFFENEPPNEIDLDFFEFQNKEDGIINKEIKINENIIQPVKIEYKDTELKFNLRYSGLFQIVSNLYITDDISEVIEKGYRLSFSNFLISPNQYKEELNNQMIVRFMMFSNEEFYIDINNFYIMHYDLEQFINGNAKKINVEELIEKKPRIHKQQNQTNFIKALLELHYNVTDPENARRVFENKITKDFARKGIVCEISPVTLRNWLKAEF